MQQPLRLLAGAGGADEGQAHDTERSAGAAGQREDDLVLAPLLGLVRAGVPHRHAARAVLSGGDLAGESQVLDRVRLGHDREMVAIGRLGDAAGDRPALQHAVPFEPEIEVQPPCVVLLDDEPERGAGRARSGDASGGGRERLRRRVGRALADVGRERIGDSGSKRGEQIARGRHALEHLVEAQVSQERIVELVPRAGRCDHRLGASSQRVRRDGGLRAVVLAPVDEDLAAADGLRHRAHDEITVVGLQRPGELAGECRDLVARARAVQRRVQVDPLGPARHGQRIHADTLQDLTCPPRDLGAFGEARTGSGIEVEDEAVRRAP